MEEALFLSRVQFAFVISFHILFPAFTIGLASWIALLELRYFVSRKPVFANLSRFWTQIFAITFGMGVVSGVVMTFQFGTNWSRFSEVAGNVMGPLISYEVMTAFFLEATFLGVLLFGRGRVPDWLHLLSAFAVALGMLLSSFWILSANSWMHTPAGAFIGVPGPELGDDPTVLVPAAELQTWLEGVVRGTTPPIDWSTGARFYPEDWLAIIFNPSFPYRLAHMVTAAFLTTAFVIAAVSAWHLRRTLHVAESREGLSKALWLIALLAPVQAVLGDMHGLNTLEHQPAKIAAMEGHWEPQRGAPLLLLAWPDRGMIVSDGTDDPQGDTGPGAVGDARGGNHFEIGIPYLSSLILTHTLDGETPGLREFPPAYRPPVEVLFWTFRVMVGIGLVMIAVAGWSLWLRYKRQLYVPGRFHLVMTWAFPLGFVAVLAGWFTTEIGRQPWLVYGLLHHADGVTPALTAGQVWISLTAFITAYAIIFPTGVWFILRVVRTGPIEAPLGPPASAVKRPKRPLSAVGAPTAPSVAIGAARMPDATGAE